ncbi:GstE2.2 family protein [Megaselia abdita]
MGKLILHGMKLSPCVRGTFAVAAAIGVEMEYKFVDLFKGESRTPEFLEMNPVHAVPVLDDDGRYIIDGHAILSYLVDQYGKDDSLYPKDPFQRAMVDQRLHFDSGILYIRLRNLSLRVYLEDHPKFPQKDIDAVYESYDYVEKFLSKEKYLAGDHLTIADLCCVCTITSGALFAPISEERYPKISDWIKRLSALPYYEETNGKDNAEYLEFLKMILTQKNGNANIEVY